MNELYTFAATYAMKRPVRINLRLPSKLPNTIIAFSDLCVKHNIIDLYIWLSWRFPKFFVEKEICMQQRNYALGLIEETLMTTGSAFNGKSSLNDDYTETRKKLAKLTNNTFLPPDLDGFKSVRESTKLYLEQLESIAPTFRRKQWGKVTSEEDASNVRSNVLSKSGQGNSGSNGNSQWTKKPGAVVEVLDVKPKSWSKVTAKVHTSVNKQTSSDQTESMVMVGKGAYIKNSVRNSRSSIGSDVHKQSAVLSSSIGGISK